MALAAEETQMIPNCNPVAATHAPATRANEQPRGARRPRRNSDHCWIAAAGVVSVLVTSWARAAIAQDSEAESRAPAEGRSEQPGEVAPSAETVAEAAPVTGGSSTGEPAPAPHSETTETASDRSATSSQAVSQTTPSPAPSISVGSDTRAAPAATVEHRPAASADSQNLEVTVSGVRPGSAEDGYRARRAYLGAFGELSLKDLPYSVNVTPAAAWENRNAHTEQDVLLTNPTVSKLMSPFAPGGGGMSRNMVRGSVLGDQGVLRDGLVDRSFTFPWSENVERAEVMNGLNSLLTGFGTLGGTVNYVSKRPSPESMATVSFGNYWGGLNFVTGDIGGPLPFDDAKRWAYRSIVHKEGGHTFVDGSKERRTLITSVLSYKPHERVELSANIAYQSFFAQGLQNYIDVNPAAGVRVPSASIIDPSRQYGQSWTSVESNKLLVGGSLKAPITEVMSLRAAYRHGTMWRRYNTTFGTFTDNLGNYTESFVATPRQFEHTHSEYALADIRFATLAIKHVVTAGYNGTQFYYERGNDQKSILGTSNVAEPLVVQSVPAWVSGSANAMRTAYDSLIVGDRMSWKFLSFIGGVNYSQIRSVSWALGNDCTTPGQCPVGGRSDTTQSAFTPSAGLVLRPLEVLALYGSYIEGLQTGGAAPATAQNAYEFLSPSHSRQFELGLKGDLAKLQVSLAVFRIDQINELLDPVDNYYKQDGRQVNQGVEFLNTGPLGYGFSMIGGFTLMRDRVRRARNNTALEGKVPVNVPERSARLFLDYLPSVVPGLAIDAGLNYSGKRYVDNLNTDDTGSVLTIDAGARYGRGFSKYRFDLILHMENLANRRYWAYYRTGSGLLAGAPRTVSVTVRIKSW